MISREVESRRQHNVDYERCLSKLALDWWFVERVSECESVRGGGLPTMSLVFSDLFLNTSSRNAIPFVCSIYKTTATYYALYRRMGLHSEV